MNAEALGELEAIDATLRGAPIGPEHAQLAELVRELRASRPAPRGEFVHELDAKAAEGFRGQAAPRRSRRPQRLPRSRARAPVPSGSRLMRPALGAVLALALAAAVAVPLTLTGGDASQKAPAPLSSVEKGAVRSGAVATSAPTPVTPPTATPGAANEAEASAGKTALQPATSSAPATGTRQVERTATLALGVAPDAVESTAQQVFTLAGSFNGYVRQSNVSSGSAAPGAASFGLRIPSSNLAGAIAALSHLGRVRSENDTTNDVTDQFNALSGSLADLQAERQSLLRQLAATSEAKREASLKARLHSLQGRISQLQGALAALRSRVNYTNVALTLTAETSAASKKQEGDFTPGGAARNAGRILEVALAVVVIGSAALVPLAAVALGAWWLVVGTRRRSREHALDVS